MIFMPMIFRKSRVNIILFLVARHLSKQSGFNVALPSMTLELRRRKVEKKSFDCKEVRKIQQEMQ